MNIWISRDNGYGSESVDIWERKPERCKSLIKGEGTFFAARKKIQIERLGQLHHSHFRKLFGFTPRKGTCKQYEFTLKEVK